MPYCCNPLTVSEGNKLRLVLDLRHVNLFTLENKFKYEGIDIVRKLFEQGYYFCTFDLKSGYHHVSIHPDHHKYLGFSWVYKSGITRYFLFTVLPFGLNTASYLFTKLLRPLVKRWRGFGIRSAIYLDDGIYGSTSAQNTVSHTSLITSDLDSAGLTINYPKSVLIPTQVGIWLGFVIDTVTFSFYVPEKKLHKLITLMNDVKNTASARQISKVTGNLMAMKPAIGPLVQLISRKMYSFIDNSPTWDTPHTISSGVTDEIQFWTSNLYHVNGYKIKDRHSITKVVYTDASDHSYGGYIVQRLGNTIAHGSFSIDEIDASSTYRELLAVKYVIQSFPQKLQHQTVLWHSDNFNVSTIINKGSPKDHLQDLALDIFCLSLRHDIKLISKWIPREENEEADSISKYVDSDNWGVDIETFDFIENEFGKLTIDRFANAENTKLPRFNSRFFCPAVETVNAFTANWQGEFNWLCPPINLIADTLKHARICRCTGVLLVPEWPSSYFWPLLTSNGKSFYSFVTDYRLLDPYFHADCKIKTVFRGFAKFRTLALLIDFTRC